MTAALDLTFAGVGGRTVLTRRRYRWPLLIGRVFPDSVHPATGSVTVQNSAGTVIPGDIVTQRIAVIDGGSAIVRGQGATTVAGIPGGAEALEQTVLRVDATSRLLLDAAPRILTPHARYRQRTEVCVAPGGRAVLVDAVVLHPDLTDPLFGGYRSDVVITAPDGTLLALDAQHLDATPRVRRAPTAFATVYVVGTGLDTVLTSRTPELEALSVLTGDRRTYVGVSDLPNDAGWAVRIAASDGGVLRTAVAAVTAQVGPERVVAHAHAEPRA
ncbi:urease accessory protein UreD [Mycolicibacterium litorale]|uniref:Urease accessory protein UreD n=1 Tax=Mycolicibacterium litorale TaxID=758802 RepID=A0A6S6PBB0_9MYCO|nr:urease accessory protein UreD [Mycolicibacterium litorale]BCI56034.1 urease accessory protein UreD [Mycolicibacterium litorale]